MGFVLSAELEISTPTLRHVDTQTNAEAPQQPQPRTHTSLTEADAHAERRTRGRPDRAGAWTLGGYYIY
eukprot:32652-Prymnesium_polylepis.1